jgi:hypothetical protein
VETDVQLLGRAGVIGGTWLGGLVGTHRFDGAVIDSVPGGL